MARRLIHVALSYFLSDATAHNYSTHWLEQPCNHDDFSTNSLKLHQRYLVGDAWWSPGGPVLLHTGNEGPIEAFVDSAGFHWILAQEMGALVVFAEHRFYGSSGTSNGSCGASPFQFLSATAALQDLANLVDHLRTEWMVGDAAVIAIGGSYGGMLSAWLRLKYPHLVDGALASSAPVILAGEAKPEAVYDIVGSNFPCADGLRRGFHQMLRANNSELVSSFQLCEEPKTRDAVIGLVQQAFMHLAERNYPYPVDGQPANPAAAACKQFRRMHSALDGLAAAASVAPGMNPLPGQCLNLTALAPSFQATLPGLMPGAWSYQRCSDIIIPYSANGSSSFFLPCDIFEPNCWNISRFSAWCSNVMGAVPQVRSALQSFGGRHIAHHGLSNVVFTNGLLDPWGAGGLHGPDVPSSAKEVEIRWMAGAAHHLELRTPNPSDPPDVRACRDLQRKYVRKWISEKKLLQAAVLL
jgi:pimeloyl-ACP methyl ester carboxylesterase